MNWLIKSGEKTLSDITLGSGTWGNFSESEFEYYTNISKSVATKSSQRGTRIASGAYEGAKANNIYDLSGNVNECSFIMREENYRYLLGGDYFNKGFQVYADSETYSGAYHEYNIDRVGFRNTLYIR
jgi:hypothetical protein